MSAGIEQKDFVVRGSLSVLIIGVGLAVFGLALLVNAVANSEMFGPVTFVFIIAVLVMTVWVTIVPYFSWEIKVIDGEIIFRHDFKQIRRYRFEEITRIEVRRVKRLRGSIQYITLFAGEKAAVWLDSNASTRGFKLFAQRLEHEVETCGIEVEHFYGR